MRRTNVLWFPFILFTTIACLPTSPLSPNLSNSPGASNLPTLPEKAEKVCGDRLPEDPESYPISFYPVFVEYSVENLSKVKKHFCEDAIQKNSKSLGRKVVQVASFASREKAESFKANLSQYFELVIIGEPTIIKNPQTELGDRRTSGNALNTIEAIAKAALLNPEQTQELLDLENSNMISFTGTSEKVEMGKVKVLVPTYIPSGFSLVEFSRVSSSPKTRYDMRYRLRYKSFTGESFAVANFEILGDGPAFLCDFGRLDHPVLGKIRRIRSIKTGEAKPAESSLGHVRL
jgi:hypothetical protein